LKQIANSNSIACRLKRIWPGFKQPMRDALSRPAIARLVDDHADIVLSSPDQVSAKLRGRASEVLDDTERSRAARLVSDRGRNLFIFSHGLLRLTLAHYLDADARELCFTRSPQGRPELDTRGIVPIRFNLSHTDGLVGCVIARSADCGIDVESLGSIEYRDLVAPVLAPTEYAALLELGEEERRDRFLEIWTLKEAYLKARGLGLSRRLRDIAFSGFGDELRCSVSPEVDDGPVWRFLSRKANSRHRVAAALRTDGRPATFSIIKADMFL
jgi:4'-phosphopantetheinyl transferase